MRDALASKAAGKFLKQDKIADACEMALLIAEGMELLKVQVLPKPPAQIR